MSFLGIDTGTTRCKVGLFDDRGNMLCLAARPTRMKSIGGFPEHDPDDMWNDIVDAIREVLRNANVGELRGVGVAGMAEAGLLVDRRTGAPRTAIIPWYDSRAEEQVADVLAVRSPEALFAATGLHPSFKYALPKLLWLRRRNPHITDGALWLSVPDYIVFRLTGQAVTDPSLAARTSAFDIRESCWDTDLLVCLGLDPALFPRVLPAGVPAGTTRAPDLPVLHGVPAAVCGHDHLCAAFAMGIDTPNVVLDSMGTAESLVGVLNHPDLGREAYESGLVVCPHVIPGRYCWMGGLRASGSSIEWLRSLLASPPMPYDDLRRLLREAGQEPTGLLYFPYLYGTGGASHSRGPGASVIGISAGDGRGALARAVLEGTAYEVERLRRAAERVTDVPMREIVAVGGGTDLREWVQVKADVSGCTYVVTPRREATAAGAALAVRMHIDSGLPDVVYQWPRDTVRYLTDKGRHSAYRDIYDRQYLPLRTVMQGGEPRLEAVAR